LDLLKLLKGKAEHFSVSEEDRGVSSVVNHIGVAEKHFENGKLGDDYLFNDVVYRSNQAFEGALKEAYRIITGNNPDNITPYKIEKYFEENAVLKDRVLKLFTNYRTEWRNKSTHDYRLYFSEQEAFLAIVSISAFINILFDQMLEKRAYDKESEELKNNPASKSAVNINLSIDERVVDLLLKYSKEVPGKMIGSVLPRITEVELIGSFYAYLNSLANDIKVSSEYVIKSGPRRLIADFFLQKDAEKLIIEFKNPIQKISESLNGGTQQLFTYLIASGVECGILYIPPTSEDQEMEVITLPIETKTSKHKVIQVYPKDRLHKTVLPGANVSLIESLS
jgi:hypothetical protein